jgi:hypothetical protein
VWVCLTANCSVAANTCPYLEICDTPTIRHDESTERIKDVCLTEKHKACSTFCGIEYHHEQGAETEFDRIKARIREKLREQGVEV